MPGKRKDREYYTDQTVTVGEVLDKYQAIKETFCDDKALMNTSIHVTDNMLSNLNLSIKKK